jgi:ABC-type histidine transport system ATPase subunit
MGLKTKPQHNTISNKSNKFTKNKEPQWMCRLKTKITNIRTKLAQMIQYRNGPRSKKLTRKVANIIQPVEIDKLQSDKLTEKIDHYTQKLAVYSKRLRRYKECTK